LRYAKKLPVGTKPTGRSAESNLRGLVYSVQPVKLFKNAAAAERPHEASDPLQVRAVKSERQVGVLDVVQ